MNKVVIFFLFILCAIGLHAQETLKADTPKIICKLKVGNTIEFDTKSIKLIKVYGDSRCPSDATCIWAGEVKATVEIYESNTLTATKELIFGAKNINPNQIKELLITDKKTVFGHNINPYPSSKTQIDPKEYYIELLVK
ncbi:hypothetical protein [Aquimarina sp. AU474]|uniref:hypothetical protein n=1 Tax=Aquimarina sp. AU474 TaxID=2108529 RepID=UPI000D696A68|nr:hypothetical protein [Aquimarina sp. AU474]